MAASAAPGDEIVNGRASRAMGRHESDVLAFRRPKGGAGWIDRYRCEWGMIVGDRIRRLRRDREMSLVQLATAVEKPGGGSYSPGYFSRIERGWASAPLWVYIAIASAFGIHPWLLLGPEEVQKEVTDSELTLVRFLRDQGLAPHEALVRLATVRAPQPVEPLLPTS